MAVSGISRPLRLRLFLEGQEVPVIAASVNIGVNGPATASIQVLPLDSGLDLKPRTMVHLFFLDQVPTEQELEQAFEDNVTESELRRGYDKLLFTGEVIGFAFGQTPMSRSLTLQCVDFSSYWDACHATAIEYGPGGNAFYNQASVYGSNASLFDDIVNFQSQKVLSWIRDSKPQTPGLQNVSGLAGGIIAMLEAIGGVPGHSRGVNDFFTFSELRGRILAQITAEENDNTAAQILSAKVFDEWLRNGLQNIGQQVTFRDMLRLLCQYIYYDTVPNPVAKFDKSFDKGKEKTTVVTELRANPLIGTVEAGFASTLQGIREAQSYNPANAPNAANDLVLQLEKYAKEIAKVKTKEASTVGNYVASTIQILKQRIMPFASLTSEASAAAFKAAGDELEKAQAGVKALPKVTYETGVRSTATTARLRTQIIRPDCFFAAPPRCNVIFPEHFSQVSYDRSYLSEVTRSLTLVYNTLVGRDQMLADKVMAPNNGLDMAKIQKQVGPTGYTLLMPHERHTGIIPRSEWLPNVASFGKQESSSRAKQRGARLSWVDKASLFHFFKYRFGPRQANVAGRFNPYLVCGFPALVMLKPFIVSPVHLGFLEGNSGTGEVSVDQVIDAIQIAPEQMGAPYQLLGMIGGLNHSVNQEGGTTSVAMHHVRKHQGIDDEFIGVFSQSLTTIKRRVKVPIVASNDLLLQQGAYAGVPEALKLIELLVKVTPASAQKGVKKKKAVKQQIVQREQSTVTKSVDRATGKKLTVTKTTTINQTLETIEAVDDPFTAKGRIDKISREVLLPKPPGVITTNGKGRFGKVVGVEVTDAELIKVPIGTYAGKFVYRSVILYEDVDVKVDEAVPVEEIIRPSWFSDKYSNPQIGTEIYTPFFGTTSIIDSLSFTGLTPDSIKLPADPEGEAVDPTKKTEVLLKELKNNNDTKSRLTIERAVNVLSYLYGLVKTEGKDVDQFIKDYATRPVATLIDMLGTEDLQITYDAKGAATIVKGSPGFHGLSLDRRGVQQGNLAGLLQDPDRQLPRVNKSGEKAPISPVYDVRREKLDRVDKYILAIRDGFGLRG